MIKIVGDEYLPPKQIAKLPKTPYQLRSVWKDFIVAENSDEYFGIIDNDSKTVVPFKYRYIGSLTDGVAVASYYGWEYDHWILLGEDGTVYSPNQYIIDDGIDEQDSIARAYNYNGDKRVYGAVNLKGEIIVPFEYDFICHFSDGCAVAQRGAKYGIIDVENNILVPFKYAKLLHCDNSIFVATQATKSGKQGVIDRYGNIIVPFIYDDIYEFYYGRAAVKRSGKWGAIDEQGNIVVPFVYDSSFRFYNYHTAYVERNGLTGWIDRDGNIIIPIEYELQGGFNGDIARAKHNGKYGFIDIDGEIVVPFIHDYIQDLPNSRNGLANLGGGKHYFLDDYDKKHIVKWTKPEHWQNGLEL